MPGRAVILAAELRKNAMFPTVHSLGAAVGSSRFDDFEAWLHLGRFRQRVRAMRSLVQNIAGWRAYHPRARAELVPETITQNLMHSIEGVREVKNEWNIFSSARSAARSWVSLTLSRTVLGRSGRRRPLGSRMVPHLGAAPPDALRPQLLPQPWLPALMLEASAAPRAVLRVLSRCGFQLVPDGYEPPCVDHHVEQVDGGVPAVQTPVRILLLSHFPPPLEQVTPLLLGMRPGKAGPVELGTLCHGRHKHAGSGKHHAAVAAAFRQRQDVGPPLRQLRTVGV